MNYNAVDFWTRVNSLIKSKKTKQQAIADMCGISYQTFRGWVTHKTFPDAAEAIEIATALGTSVEYLVTGEDSRPKPDTSAIISSLEDLISRIKAL